MLVHIELSMQYRRYFSVKRGVADVPCFPGNFDTRAQGRHQSKVAQEQDYKTCQIKLQLIKLIKYL